MGHQNYKEIKKKILARASTLSKINKLILHIFIKRHIANPRQGLRPKRCLGGLYSQ
jgi:hypothetical protein